MIKLNLNINTYNTRIIHNTLQTIPKTQHKTTKTLNFNKNHTLFHIILPQTIIKIIPTFNNLTIHNLKNTTLTSLITM
ncbi:ectoine/hydroxyectoine ABC transporter permease subunit EhuC, partial [Enterococcus hirae]